MSPGATTREHHNSSSEHLPQLRQERESGRSDTADHGDDGHDSGEERIPLQSIKKPRLRLRLCRGLRRYCRSTCPRGFARLWLGRLHRIIRAKHLVVRLLGIPVLRCGLGDSGLGLLDLVLFPGSRASISVCAALVYPALAFVNRSVAAVFSLVSCPEGAGGFCLFCGVNKCAGS